MATQTHVDIEDGIARISMDDGKVNALSTEMIAALEESLDTAEKAEAVTVISGRPGIFSAGFDLKTFQRGMDATLEMLTAGASLIERLLRFPYPVLTVCEGHAYPAGAFLMLSADVRFASAGAWKIGMNEVAIQMTVPKFAIELARHRLTPPGFARITTAGMFDPQEATRLGYLDRVVAADELPQAVKEETERLRSLDMPSFKATKARVNGRALQAIRAAVEDEMREFSR